MTGVFGVVLGIVGMAGFFIAGFLWMMSTMVLTCPYPNPEKIQRENRLLKVAVACVGITALGSLF